MSVAARLPLSCERHQDATRCWFRREALQEVQVAAAANKVSVDSAAAAVCIKTGIPKNLSERKTKNGTSGRFFLETSFYWLDSTHGCSDLGERRRDEPLVSGDGRFVQSRFVLKTLPAGSQRDGCMEI